MHLFEILLNDDNWKNLREPLPLESGKEEDRRSGGSSGSTAAGLWHYSISPLYNYMRDMPRLQVNAETFLTEAVPRGCNKWDKRRRFR